MVKYVIYANGKYMDWSMDSVFLYVNAGKTKWKSEKAKLSEWVNKWMNANEYNNNPNKQMLLFSFTFLLFNKCVWILFFFFVLFKWVHNCSYRLQSVWYTLPFIAPLCTSIAFWNSFNFEYWRIIYHSLLEWKNFDCIVIICRNRADTNIIFFFHYYYLILGIS